MRIWWKGLLLPAVAAAALLPALLPSASVLAQEPGDATDEVLETIAPDHAPGGRVHLRGVGTLRAAGHGDIYLAGHIIVSGVVHGGTLTVIDRAGDAEIVVEASGPCAQDTLPDSTKVVITDPDGRFRISGSRVEVKFDDTRSSFFAFFARGAGHAILSGHGRYRVNGGWLHRWAV